MDALRKADLSRALTLLTDDQKWTWGDMTGEPFDVANFRRVR